MGTLVHFPHRKNSPEKPRPAVNERKWHQPSTWNKDIRYANRRIAGLFALAGSVAAIGFFGPKAIDMYDASDTYNPKAPGESAVRDDFIGSVVLADGARLRTSPHVPDESIGVNNIVATLDSENIIATNGGVLTSKDNNGTWYGIKTEEIIANANPAEQADIEKKLGADRDGFVWINNDRAEAR